MERVEISEGCVRHLLKAMAWCCAVTMALLFADLIVVGFMGWGVASAVPGMVRAERLAALEKEMDADGRALVESCYRGPNSSGIRMFAGNPQELSRWSDLSRALSTAAARVGVEAAGHRGAGVCFVLEEYQALGIDLTYVRRLYVRSSLTQLGACAIVLALSRYASCRLAAWLPTGRRPVLRSSRRRVERPQAARNNR